MKTLIKILFLASALTIIGCNSSKATMLKQTGHWGNRSSWNPKNEWIQDYYSDYDAHLIGWIYGNPSSLSIRASCEDSHDSDGGILLGLYETEEDAQMAVSTKCPETPANQ